MSSFSIPLSGLNQAADQLNSAAENIAAKGPSPQGSVDLIEARNSEAANAKVVRIMDQLQRSAIDMYA